MNFIYFNIFSHSPRCCLGQVLSPCTKFYCISLTLYPFELRVCPHECHRHQLDAQLHYLCRYDPCQILLLIFQGKELCDKTSTTCIVIMVGKMCYVSMTFIPLRRYSIEKRYNSHRPFYNA